ncbi:MAG: glycosyltransferase [Candidatus Magasanikbacteria bacterium]|nr:glycosyltransferase [Candidatus Magasanikbacteria bacterium]
MSQSIHIVHIIPALGFGGAERFVVDLVNNSRPEDYRYSIITFFSDNPLEVAIRRSGAPVTVVPKHGKISLRLFLDLRHKLSELRPDIVHTHLFGADLWGRVAAWSLGIPVVTTEHSTNHDESSLKHLVKRLLGFMSKNSVACSKDVRLFMKKYYGSDPNKVEIIHNGIDIERFCHLPPPAWKKPLKLLMVGRLTRQKGHDIALAALAKLKDLPWQLTIVGNGPWHHDVIERIRALGLADRVTRYPFTQNIEEHLARHDILLMPSRWEGLGVVAMEAMAAGRTVIGSEVGGIPEIIESEKTGYLVPSEDPSALAHKLRWCFAHPAECQRVGDAARTCAKEHFGIADTVKKYETVYRRVIAGTRQSKAVGRNIKAHNRLARRYDQRHGEIFNPIEQARLEAAVRAAIASVRTNQAPVVALDYGCGSGNVTKFLTAAGTEVIAADLARDFFPLIERQIGGAGRVKTLLVNGRDLRDLPDQSVDCVTTYSVLHHVPDYLGILDEFVRVLRSGGIIYIDHEHSQSYWANDPIYAEFKARVTPKESWHRFFRLQSYRYRWHQLWNPYYQEEGDIHVWPHDHIMWDDIIRRLESRGCSVIDQTNYLVYKAEYDPAVYREYAGRCNDMAMLVARKK